MDATASLKQTGTHLCRLDGKGRAVIVKTRKTVAAGQRMEKTVDLQSRGFIVRSYVVIDRTASDHGTVYFFDANGEMMDAPVNC